MNNNNVLVGKVITDVRISDDKYQLIVDVKDEPSVVAECYAECCSHTWIESLELPALGFPATVLSVEDIDLPEPDYDVDEFECLRVYGCKISTDRGEIVVDFRNESNGYYGGSLDWPSVAA